MDHLSTGENCNPPWSRAGFLAPVLVVATMGLCLAAARSPIPTLALAMPLILIAGQDLARLLQEFSPPNRELPASRAWFAPLFGALLFHGLAIGTVFVTHAQVSSARAGGAGECAGCGSGGGGCGSGRCGESATAAKASSGG